MGQCNVEKHSLWSDNHFDVLFEGQLSRWLGGLIQSRSFPFLYCPETISSIFLLSYQNANKGEFHYKILRASTSLPIRNRPQME